MIRISCFHNFTAFPCGVFKWEAYVKQAFFAISPNKNNRRFTVFICAYSKNVVVNSACHTELSFTSTISVHNTEKHWDSKYGVWYIHKVKSLTPILRWFFGGRISTLGKDMAFFNFLTISICICISGSLTYQNSRLTV